MKKYISMLTALILATSLFSQDFIIKKDSDTLSCKIKEVGVTDINYTVPEYGDEVSFSIEKDNVAKLVFASGKEMAFKKELTNPENYTENKKNAIKFHFLSPVIGKVTFGYERSIKPGQSFEVSLGAIFNGYYYGPTGGYVRAGYKFIRSPDYYVSRMKYSHILKGAYIKPEVALGVVEDVVSGALYINFGRQSVFNNAFLFDMYCGLGYAGQSHYSELYYGTLPFEVFSMTGGIKIGVLF